jgi:hypothetical protein
MGRFAKNTVFDSGNYALGLPATSSSFRPNVAGFTSQTALRYSTSSDKLEYYAILVMYIKQWPMLDQDQHESPKTALVVSSLRSNYGPLSFNYTVGTLWKQIF